MWDKPHQLNNLSSVLFGISLLLLFYGAAHYVLHLPHFKLRSIQLSEVPRHVDPAQVEAVARNELLGNFFTVDLEHMRQVFEKLPWVRKVSVRRHFPWTLQVEIEEHIALARWNGTEWVNTHGEIFSAASEKMRVASAQFGDGDQQARAQSLPQFFGQPDSAAEITQGYRAMSEQMSVLKQQITEVHLSPRRAWQLRLDNGLWIKLGREQSQQRLARFVVVYPWYEDGGQKTEDRSGVQYVDLRYRNGFSVKYQPRAGSGETS